MKHIISLSILSLLLCCCGSTTEKEPTLKEVLGKHFLIGVAMNTDQVAGIDPKAAPIVKKHFNAIVPENCMKGEVIHPEEDRYDWTEADRIVKFAEDNGLTITGHCLVWHSQAPKWMFTDKEGKPVSREVLIDRMHKHIATVVGRYKGRIKGWDVVNETVEDNGEMRRSPYYNIIGPDYIELAFKFAHEADPDAELYINDYSMSKPSKRETTCRIVRELKEKGIRVDAIGMQSHNGLDYPDLAEYEKSMDAFAACGVKIMMTELDLNMLPNPENFGGADINQNFQYDEKMNPYRNGITEEGIKTFNKLYTDLFKIYFKHRDQISRITFWGVNDGTSWLNDFPVKGRTNYPLFFDRDYNEKPILQQVIKIFE